MAERLIFRYDSEGDILHIDQVPYTEQESEELDDNVVARLNPDTGKVENLDIMFFSSRGRQLSRNPRPSGSNLDQR